MDDENVSFEELLNNSFNKNKRLEKVVTGKVIGITDKDEVFVDINYKADGIIPKREFSFDENESPKDSLKIGDEITCEVLKMNDGEGNVLLSYKKMKGKMAREEFEKRVSNDEIFEEKVSETNQNGLIVNYNGIRIFIPNSLSTGQKDVVRFKIIENNPKEHKIVGSCKKILDEEKAKNEQQFWDNVELGKTYEGEVNSICSYGAFIDIDGVQGLLHVSEMSWERNANAQDLVKQGQKIKVSIKNLDKENKRIQLACELKGEDPWSKLEYNIGDVVRVKIVKLMNFGAFAELQKGIEGLIHISQISEEKIAKAEDKLEIGEEVNAKIIDLDKENKKIELSIRELEGTSQEFSSKEGK